MVRGSLVAVRATSRVVRVALRVDTVGHGIRAARYIQIRSAHSRHTIMTRLWGGVECVWSNYSLLEHPVRVLYCNARVGKRARWMLMNNMLLRVTAGGAETWEDLSLDFVPARLTD